MKKKPPTSRQKKDRLRWLYLCENRSLNARLVYEKRNLISWYLTEYKKHLDSFGGQVANYLF